MIVSPRLYYSNGAFLRRCFELLGPMIKSCHAKDIVLQPKLTVHLDEARPGLGTLDWATYLKELDKLEPNVPLMVEHLPSAEDYAKAAEHIRSVAASHGLRFLSFRSRFWFEVGGENL